MESRSMIVLATWISVSVISVFFVWVGGASLGNYIFVGLLILFALGVTFGISGMRELMPDKKPEIQMLTELQNIKTKLEALSKEIAEIKKTIQE